ncbi:hypothetical protein EZV73_05365 [Acidaminobacter sp. JC074]|uniref:IPT/TIG domain-containing protein n=1 Tax=Acidaminobacter sp. JC074 TaxID=2530199 RepID=UPI001F0DCD53|nr:IPT/TIG domain-containing protein [Acidaminobacter sp. JC074]MCH4886985.1 hypothetical protein [Acidaminobacter sp. JC074]
MKRRILSLFLALVVFMTSGVIPAQATVTIGDVVVNEIIFRKVHNGYEISGSFVEIWGVELDKATILFEDSINGFTDNMGELQTDTPGFKKYYFDKDETISFGSRLAVDGVQFDLALDTFPNFTDADKTRYNVDAGDDIVLSGSSFDLIDGVNIKASYGTLEREYFDYGDFGTNTPNQITADIPPVPKGGFGDQSLSIEQVVPDAGDGTFKKEIIYVYHDVFRIVQDLGVTDPELFPNTGAKGDEFYITADNLSDTRNYQVYFVTEVGQAFTEINESEFVSLVIDFEGDTDRLTFRVPDHPDFEELEYQLVLTDTQNGSIIAEQVLPDTFSVVDASYLPTIEEIYPTQGPQEGADVQIDGRNLASINVPDLYVDEDLKTITQDIDGLHITYDNEDNTDNTPPHYAQYKTTNTDGDNVLVDVTVQKDIVIKIGGKVTYLEDESGNIRYDQGTVDSLFVRAPSADDAETDPFKDVNIEMVITIETYGPNKPANVNAFKYVFRQNVIAQDGFKFIPSSLTPDITSVVPDTMHVTGNPGAYYTGEDMMLIIDGSNFLVNRYTDDLGNTFVNKPIILIKTVNDQSLSNYDIRIDPNAEKTIGADTYKGLIFDMSDDIGTPDPTSGDNYVKNDDNLPYILDLKVVDSEGNLVAGTANNDVGTRIIARLPRNLNIDVADYKNVLVVNPTRNSQDPGKKKMQIEAIEFVDTNDIPIIESVVPNVVTVEGNEEIVITGNNFQEGAKIWLDGREITGYSREISQSGDKIILKFTAPSGPAGQTQIVVQNPSGGVATADFYYVTSFNQDPIIDSFVPEKGTADTYVVINGQNFLKEDPTAETLTGLDSLRIIGTRVYLDGQDVNEYNLDIENNITFEDYEVPKLLPFLSKDDTQKEVDVTPFKDNIYIKDDSNVYYYLTNDGDGDPVITDNLGVLYTFKYETNVVNIYKEGTDAAIGTLAANYTDNFVDGDKEGTSTLTIDGKVITITMNNNVVFKGFESGDAEVPRAAEYAESVVFVADTNPEEYYRMFVDFDNTIKFINGKDNNYTFNIEESDMVMRLNVSEKYYITDIVDTGFSLRKEKTDPNPLITFTMQTPYKEDDDNQIVGHRAKVLNSNQIAFRVPQLNSGKGYKDLKVINPDTKYDEKVDEEGFYYIEQPSSRPKITSITPAEGSVDGGYAVKIFGKDFEDTMSVYIDGVPVPPTDIDVALDGNSVTIVMPKCTKDLAGDFDVSFLDVPVVVLNNDGGTDSRPKGFKYIIPKSSPQINTMLPVKGTTNGGTIVELVGYEFRFFEPYDNLVGGPEFNVGDKLIDLFKDGEWNDLLDNPPAGALTNHPFNPEHPYYEEYLTSPILPTVYFGDVPGKIVEFASGYIKVISPEHEPGAVDVYVVNNDSGVSNKLTYTFESSTPVIDNINPNHGKKLGQELRDFYGSGFYQGVYSGYRDNDDTGPQELDNFDASIRFGEITNRDIPRGEVNSGLINAERTTVELDGDLRLEYHGGDDTLTVSVTEDGKIYRRVFNGYEDTVVYLPMEMLRQLDGANQPTGDFYHPIETKAEVHDGSTYEDMVFEYIKVEIDDKRVFVDRGYAPKTEYDSSNHLIVTTPSYYTIGSVPVLLTNPDFGTATSTFQYTYPASEPKIYYVGPRDNSPDGTSYYTKRTVLGGTQIEVLGIDFRENIKAFIGENEANIAEKSVVVKSVDGEDTTLDILIVDVPAGQLNQVGLELPVIVTNTDYGVANSSNPIDIYGNDKKPMFFVYQQPLSGPVIESISPEETSQYGGHIITLTGTDFREGATVTIGSKGGVPIANTTVSERGSKLTFVTPQGTLIPGEKTIQVQNIDYGASDLNTKITIVSYPTVEDFFEFEDETTVKWVSVEGGQRIKVTGTEFYDGAKVVFGGTRSLHTDESTGEKGLFRDDKYYDLADGYLGTDVEVISDTELWVTTPEIPLEDPYTVTVINSDGGISDGESEILYSVPVPSDPVGLKLELIDNRYIRISDYTASGHNYYEIYYYLGSKSTSQIKSNDYLDMSYLGSTDLEPYRLPSIQGIETMDSDERLIIGLKAVNYFGTSDWSNLEFLSYKDLDEVEELGDPDLDGDLGVPADKDFISEVVGADVVTTLNENSDLSYIYIDLSTPNYDGMKKRIINVPGKMIKTSNSLVRVDYDGLDVQFTPVALNTKEFQALYLTQNAYGRIESTDIEDAYSGYMLNQVPRGYKAVSKVVTIGFDARNNDEISVVDELTGTIDIVMEYDPLILSGYPETSVEMYHFNKSTNTWTKLSDYLDTSNNLVSTRTKLPGAYVLLVKRF